MSESLEKSTSAVKSAPSSTTNEKMDFSTIKYPVSTDFISSGGGRRGGGDTLSINIVNSQSNGKRVKLSNLLHRSLGSPEHLYVAQSGNQLIIGQNLPNATEMFKFSRGRGLTVIYSASLVKWLTETFCIDYNNGRVSRSFSEIEVKTQEHASQKVVFAIIKMQ